MNCRNLEEEIIDADELDLELITESVEPPSLVFMGGIFSSGGWIIAVEEE